MVKVPPGGRSERRQCSILNPVCLGLVTIHLLQLHTLTAYKVLNPSVEKPAV